MANPHPVRTGKNAAHPTFPQLVDQRLFELEVLRLAAEERLGVSEIGRRLGVNKGTVSRVLKRIMARNESPLVEEYRAVEMAALLTARAVIMRVLTTRHMHVADGRVVRDDDEPVYDDMPALAAARELRQNSESIRKLLGADAPMKAEVRVRDDLDAEIFDLAEQLARAGSSAAGRGEESPAGQAQN